MLKSIAAFLISACTVPHVSASQPGQAYALHHDPPGGPLATDDRDCGPELCLRAGTWFVPARADEDRTTLEPVFAADDRWWGWKSGGEVRGDVAYRTRAATADDVAPGAQVIYYDDGNREPPTSESFAYTSWFLARVHSVDARLHTFQVGPRGSMPISIDLARVIVETKPARAKETP